jgi:hypothetical protein
LENTRVDHNSGVDMLIVPAQISLLKERLKARVSLLFIFY